MDVAKCQTEYCLKAQCCNFWDSAVRIEPILCKLNSIALPGKFNQFWIEAYNNFVIKRAKIVLDCLCHTTACGVWFCVLEGEILFLKKKKKASVNAGRCCWWMLKLYCAWFTPWFYTDMVCDTLHIIVENLLQYLYRFEMSSKTTASLTVYCSCPPCFQFLGNW